MLTLAINLPAQWAWVSGALAAYRIVDLLSYRVHYLLVKTRTRSRDSEGIRRSIVIFWINIYELVVAFGILYLRTQAVKRGCVVLNDPVSAVYFSEITLTTVGYGEYVPTATIARLLVCAQLASGLLMASFIVPELIQFLHGKTSEKGSE